VLNLSLLVLECSRARQNSDPAAEGDVVAVGVGQIVTRRECSAADSPRQDYQKVQLY
jgi:hypothetical protein